MAKKHYFLLIDTETTQTGKVADFGAIVCDRKGNVLTSCAILVRDFYSNPDAHPLFHIVGTTDATWSRAKLPARYARYNEMLAQGSRMLASVAAVNNWLAKVAVQYAPTLTAYNIGFDAGVCDRTGINLDLFTDRFCLWHAAADKWGHKKSFLQMVLATGGFNSATPKGNWSYQTNAEIMARYVMGDPTLPAEPHTAFEDARDYELPILRSLVADTPRADYMTPRGYNWKEYQVRDYFGVK